MNREHIFFGIDHGFQVDASALVGGAIRDSVFCVLIIEELRPTRGSPLKPSAVGEQFATRIKRHGGRSGTCDGFSREAMREHYLEHEIFLEEAPEGQAGKVDTHLRLRELVNERRIKLPNHARLIAQLKAIVSKPTSGGGLQITTPRRRANGGHGDLVSALVLAAWAASNAHFYDGPSCSTVPNTRVGSEWSGSRYAGGDDERDPFAGIPGHVSEIVVDGVPVSRGGGRSFW